MSERSGVFERLKARGEEVLSRVGNELMANPHFMKALQSAIQGKEKIDQAAGRALKQMNIPTRGEFKRALARIEALESQLAELGNKAKPKPATRKGKPRRKRAAGAKPATSPPASAE